MKRFLWLALFFLPALSLAQSPDDVKISTQPLGSPFIRHFTHDYNFDIKKVARFEEKGFGRTEIITLAFISSHTGVELKVYGKRRLKMDVTLRELAEEAGMEYRPLYEKAARVKKEIEAKGDKNLPPPVFAEPKKSKKDKKKEKKKKKAQEEKKADNIPEEKQNGTENISP